AWLRSLPDRPGMTAAERTMFRDAAAAVGRAENWYDTAQRARTPSPSARCVAGLTDAQRRELASKAARAWWVSTEHERLSARHEVGPFDRFCCKHGAAVSAARPAHGGRSHDY